MSKKILIIILILVAASFVYLVISRNTKPSTGEDNLVVPDYVSVLLHRSYRQDDSTPVLSLSAVAGGGCDKASELKTTQTMNDAELAVTIEGYEFTEGPTEGACPDVITESTTEISIDLDWLKQGAEKEVTFKLAGKDNKYKISHTQNRIKLTAVSASNVISKKIGSNPPSEPQNLELAL